MQPAVDVQALVLALDHHVRRGGAASQWLDEHGVAHPDRGQVLIALDDLDHDAGDQGEPEAGA